MAFGYGAMIISRSTHSKPGSRSILKSRNNSESNFRSGGPAAKRPSTSIEKGGERNEDSKLWSRNAEYGAGVDLMRAGRG